jgi:hypothetical protein
MSAPAAAPAAATGGFFESKGFFDEHLTHAYNEPICGCKADPCGFLVRALARSSIPTDFFNTVLQQNTRRPARDFQALNGAGMNEHDHNFFATAPKFQQQYSSFQIDSPCFLHCNPTPPMLRSAFH